MENIEEKLKQNADKVIKETKNRNATKNCKHS